MREQLTKDSAKVMQDANDKCEEKLRLLRAESKKAAPGSNSTCLWIISSSSKESSGAEELVHCHKDLRETQIKSLQKDEEIQSLELHIHMLRGIMQFMGWNFLPRLKRVLRLLHLQQKTCLHVSEILVL